MNGRVPGRDRSGHRGALKVSEMQLNRRKGNKDAWNNTRAQAAVSPSHGGRTCEAAGRPPAPGRRPGAAGRSRARHRGRAAGPPGAGCDCRTLAGEFLPVRTESAAAGPERYRRLNPRTAGELPGPKPAGLRHAAAIRCPNAGQPQPAGIQASFGEPGFRLKHAPAHGFTQGLVPAGYTELPVKAPQLGLDRVHRYIMHGGYLCE